MTATTDEVVNVDGERWAFMRFTTLTERDTGRTYLTRVRVAQTPWFSIFIHRLGIPDPGEHAHDHPWWFASLILSGGYDELVADARRPWDVMMRRRLRWSVHAMRLDQCHRIHELHRLPTWTLVVTGPRRRSWGFYDGLGWFTDHKDYDHPSLRRLDEVRA